MMSSSLKSALRLGPALLSQGLLSLAQMSVPLVGSSGLDARTWGQFSIVLSVFFMAVALVRGFGVLPILIYYSGDEAQAARLRASTMGVSALVSPVLAVGVFATAAAVGLAGTGMVFGAALIAYCLYDAVRSVEVAAGRFWHMIRVDGAVLVILAGGSALLAKLGIDLLIGLPALMALAYGTAAGIYLVTRRVDSSITLRRYLTLHRYDLPFLALDGLMMSAAVGAFIVTAGWFGSLVDAGLLRTAATLLLGPLQVCLAGLSPMLIRRLRSEAKRYQADPDLDARGRSLKTPLAVATIAMTVGILYGVLLLGPGSTFFEQTGWSSLADAAPLGLSVAVLVTSLWSSSVFSSFMRYRRSNVEATVLRVVVLIFSIVSFSALLWFRVDFSLCVLAAALPWLLLPLLHAVARWHTVTFQFAPVEGVESDDVSEATSR